MAGSHQVESRKTAPASFSAVLISVPSQHMEPDVSGVVWIIVRLKRDLWGELLEGKNITLPLVGAGWLAALDLDVCLRCLDNFCLGFGSGLSNLHGFEALPASRCSSPEGALALRHPGLMGRTKRMPAEQTIFPPTIL